MTSRVPSSSYEDGESFAIIMSHLLGVDYNISSKLMLQYPNESLGVACSQEFIVSFRNDIMCGLNSSHGILFGSNYSPGSSKFKY